LDKLVCSIYTDTPEKVRRVLEGGVEIESFLFEAVSEEQAPAVHLETHLVKNVSSIRVDTEKLDQLLNLVSELVINKTSIQQAASDYPVLADGVEHLHRLTGDLQRIVMNMRMIPLETVFNRFPRMVRDTAQSLNKSVNFEMMGAETELDRTIIDDIADPLLHLLRNAVDHGIEPVSQRARLGKSKTGTITLRAYQTGNQVVIEVADDGYGLDLEKIRGKAREIGVWPGGDPDEEELINLIFSSGFTTSENVTELSGRGVGLDIVKSSIEALGGVLDVISKKNVGTTFRISLPLTLAIIQGLLVKCGQEIYVIPLSYVRETEIIYPGDVQTIGQQQIVMLRGQVLPIAFVSQLLGILDCPPLEEMSLVVVRFGEREVGLIVDELLTQQDIVIKNINWGERFFRGFLGSTILGDGSVVLILDINTLLSISKVREGN
jgi:two-component system chemotaxis sensor kinase CheA